MNSDVLIEQLKLRIEELETALELLVYEQNGPPLITDAFAWNAAMYQAYKCLGRLSAADYYLDAAMKIESTKDIDEWLERQKR